MIGAIGGRRRIASGGGVAIAQGPTNGSTGGSSSTVTFGSIPANGNLIVLLGRNSNGAETLTAPAGFSAGPAYNNPGTAPIAMFWKIAASEASASYAISAGSDSTEAQGYVLSGTHATVPVGNGGAENGGTASSATILTTAVNISAGSLVIAFVGMNSSVSGASFDNSFSAATVNVNVATASRSYPASATSQNTTATWTSSGTRVRTLLVEILKA